MTDDCENCRSPAARAPVAYRPVPTALGVRLDVAARAYLGTPFLHQGRDPAVGIDCVGLVACAVRDCGLSELLPHDFTGYARNPGRGELERRLRVAFGESAPEPCPGDVVSIDFKGQTRHVAIVGQDGSRLTLIHTASNVGRVVEHGLSDAWRKRITGIYRAGSL